MLDGWFSFLCFVIVISRSYCNAAAKANVGHYQHYGQFGEYEVGKWLVIVREKNTNK